MKRPLLLIACALAIPACDLGLLGFADEAVGTIAMDLGPPVGPPALQQQQQAPVCFTVIDVAELSITGGRPAVRRLAVEQPEIVFPDVRVRTGTSTFSATIFSNNGSTLYAGERTERIDADGFQVGLVVERRNPVLNVCVIVDWSFADGAPALCAFGLFAVFNTGVDTLRWTVFSPIEVTGNSAPTEGSVFEFSRCFQETPALRVGVTSDVGDIDETFGPPSVEGRAWSVERGAWSVVERGALSVEGSAWVPGRWVGEVTVGGASERRADSWPPQRWPIARSPGKVTNRWAIHTRQGGETPADLPKTPRTGSSPL